MPTEGHAAGPPCYPYGMQASAVVYASSVSTNMSTYEDFPVHHLLSIRNLIASTPDSSYPDSADEGSVPMHNRVTTEWDYYRIRDLRAFLSFQAASDYCLTCSDDSSEGDYGPSRECFVAEIRELDDNAADTAHAAIAVPGAPAAPGPSASANTGLQQAQLAQL